MAETKVTLQSYYNTYRPTNYLSQSKRNRTYGGAIYESDFCTDFANYNTKDKGSSIAKRIQSDLRFDEQCKKNYKNRERNNKND